jgi:2-succinyl-5-enolpyruvyl-6-hydroxy-3-cyclohexene-1-carboxylate synthase
LETWGNANRKMIICGLHRPDLELKYFLGETANDSSVAVITETTSNVQDEKYIGNIDAVLDSMNEEGKKSLQPEILVTLGGPITSKKLKTYLRKHKPLHHWHISPSGFHTDTFQSLTKVLKVDESYLLGLLFTKAKKSDSDYGNKLKAISEIAFKELHSYCQQSKFSDLKVMNTILEHIPNKSDVHLGNSSPIRYANMFKTDAKREIYYFCNRGVSGIDGTLSTAMGAAYVWGRMTTLIVGDLGFFYDSNALWNKYQKGNLRIIVINNNGGGIFRLIDGSKDTPLLEKYFEAKHDMNAEPLVKAHNLPYYSARDEKELELNLKKLYSDNSGKTAVLEVFTPNEINAEVFAGYYKLLKKYHEK